MRILRAGVVAVGVSGLTGCSGKLATIEVDFRGTTTVEGGGLLSELVGALGFDEFAQMDLTDAQELKNQGVSPGDIQEVFLTAFEMTALSPDGADLSFLDEITVYVEAPDLEEQAVAWQDSFPEGEGKVIFNVEPVDLTAYVVSESMTLTTDVSGTLPEEDTEVEAYVVLDVGVTLQGAVSQSRSSR